MSTTIWIYEVKYTYKKVMENQNNEFKTYIDRGAQRIGKELGRILADFKSGFETQGLEKELTTFIESVSGGKMLRGPLLLLGYDLFHVRPNQEIFKIAAAFEILHSSILIHDDVIDKSTKRRGKDSVYHALGGGHLGVSQAICLGDLGILLAFEIVSNTKLPASQKNEIISIIAKSVLNTALGEMLDIKPAKSQIDVDEVIRIYRLKTASYSTIAPLIAGASLAGAAEKQKALLKKFGEKLGIAFQIKDDILGSFGSEKTIGKSKKSDIQEGKNTILRVLSEKQADERRKRTLDRVFGKKISDSEFSQILNIFKESGALSLATEKANKLVSEAKDLIPKITKDREFMNILTRLAEFVVKREK
jgi:geranylgeranyl pyrophosphate synthase